MVLNTKIYVMAKNSKELETVKLPSAYVKKVRKNKKDTGVPIAVFICQAIDEKLKNQHE